MKPAVPTPQHHLPWVVCRQRTELPSEADRAQQALWTLVALGQGQAPPTGYRIWAVSCCAHWGCNRVFCIALTCGTQKHMGSPSPWPTDKHHLGRPHDWMLVQGATGWAHTVMYDGLPHSNTACLPRESLQLYTQPHICCHTLLGALEATPCASGPIPERPHCGCA